MRITANEEYGLRVILQLARILEEKKDQETPALVTLGEISAAEGISSDYVAQILLRLRRAELVESVRGKFGGYKLIRPADEINLQEILASLGDDNQSSIMNEDFCSRYKGNEEVCVHKGECAIKPVWLQIAMMTSKFFKSISLKQLLDGEVSTLEVKEESLK